MDQATQTFEPGDAIYAKRAGNKTFAWYIIGRQTDNPTDAFVATAFAHREHGAQRDSYMGFTNIRHIDRGRYAWTTEQRAGLLRDPHTASSGHACPRCGHPTLPPAVMPSSYRMCARCGAHFDPSEADVMRPAGTSEHPGDVGRDYENLHDWS